MAKLTRRMWLTLLGLSSAGVLLRQSTPVGAQVSRQATQPLPDFTGPGPNPYWNSTSPFAVYPQKLPLLRLTDRSIQLETPRQYFRTPFTPNEAFYVRYHLDRIRMSKYSGATCGCLHVRSRRHQARADRPAGEGDGRDWTRWGNVA